MTNFNTLRTIAFFLLLTLVACSKEQEQLGITKAYPGVEPELWSYFEAFERASADRGRPIDLLAAGITGSIEKIHAHGTVGLCNHRLDEPNHVIIDVNFWETASANSKEMIVFHELGHCILERGHNDEKRSDGTCASIMRSGRGGCIDFYTKDNKHEYLDELFTETAENRLIRFATAE